jgi:hypothetical protein
LTFSTPTQNILKLSATAGKELFEGINAWLESKDIAHNHILDYLSGKAYVKIQGTDWSLQSLDCYFDQAIFDEDNFEKRLLKLFTLKEKWTIGEIDAFLGEFVEPGVKLLVVLGKLTRQVKDVNPFNPKQ